MNEIDILKKISAIAGKEEPPEVAVNKAVITAINSQKDGIEQPLVWMAALASAAAVGVCVLALETFDLWLDPILIGAFSFAAWVTL